MIDDTHSEEMQDQLEPIQFPFDDKPTQSPPPPSSKPFKEKDTIVIGADHRGYELKEHIKFHALKELHLQVMDIGVHNSSKWDYPLVAQALCKQLLGEDVSALREDMKTTFGVLICGSGYGMSIAANRFKGIHAVVCRTMDEIKGARQHGNVNVLCIGADFTDKTHSEFLLDALLNTDFDGIDDSEDEVNKKPSRHARRIEMIEEEHYCCGNIKNKTNGK